MPAQYPVLVADDLLSNLWAETHFAAGTTSHQMDEYQSAKIEKGLALAHVSRMLVVTLSWCMSISQTLRNCRIPHM